ncbi:MAG: glycosyltransferase family 4 protein [Inquilinus limosus]|uniref:Glycosyltransferase family 4 protein n=1 Tax=Inquilinus limosus TaxID=171674 RepID=A0A952FLB6_9PROT|nr:glycosyltransferase family 4 protein [Inquilinus limosus]
MTIAFLLPGDPESRTGGYIYDKRIVEGLRGLGRRVTLHRLGDGFPFPTEAEMAEAAAVLRGLPDGTLTVVDGLAFSVLPRQMAAEASRLRLVALIHHPLAFEQGLSPTRRQALEVSEKAALTAARRVIVTSPGTARDLQGYGVEAGRIGVVLPGTDPTPPARGSGEAAPVLLCVATLTPRKGHLDLVAALQRLAGLPWRLVCAGSLERDAEHAKAVLAAAEGLPGRIRFLGEINEPTLLHHYDRSDLFVLPSHHEGYGMALAEASARGLPIVSTTGGAIPDTVPPDAGILVPPGDVDALAEALRRLLTDPGARLRLREAGLAARARLPGWPDQAAAFAHELDLVG